MKVTFEELNIAGHEIDPDCWTLDEEGPLSDCIREGDCRKALAFLGYAVTYEAIVFHKTLKEVKEDRYLLDDYTEMVEDIDNKMDDSTRDWERVEAYYTLATSLGADGTVYDYCGSYVDGIIAAIETILEQRR